MRFILVFSVSQIDIIVFFGLLIGRTSQQKWGSIFPAFHNFKMAANENHIYGQNLGIAGNTISMSIAMFLDMRNPIIHIKMWAIFFIANKKKSNSNEYLFWCYLVCLIINSTLLIVSK